jgi:hypothetical protein
MFRRALFALLRGLSLTPAQAQFDANIACHSDPRTTESFKKKLWDGYEISLGLCPIPGIWMHGSDLQLCGESRVSDDRLGWRLSLT